MLDINFEESLKKVLNHNLSAEVGNVDLISEDITVLVELLNLEGDFDDKYSITLDAEVTLNVKQEADSYFVQLNHLNPVSNNIKVDGAFNDGDELVDHLDISEFNLDVFDSEDIMYLNKGFYWSPDEK